MTAGTVVEGTASRELASNYSTPSSHAKTKFFF
jgi:hypothetical protein